MNNSSIHQSNLDVIALETKHQSDFERSQRQQEFCKNYRDELRDLFADGKYDGELDLEPEPYQWFNPAYRKGYLAGVTVTTEVEQAEVPSAFPCVKFNELFSA